MMPDDRKEGGKLKPTVPFNIDAEPHNADWIGRQRPRRGTPNGPAILDRERLVAAVLESGKHLGVVAILLVGSFARGTADSASDLDVVAFTRASDTFLQCGTWQGLFIEVFYNPLERARSAPIRRATLQGAKVLFDPEDVFTPWLSSLQARFDEPPPVSKAQLEYARWGLAHWLETMTWLASSSDRTTFWYVCSHWLDELVGYLYDAAGVWTPNIRRQLDGLDELHPNARDLIGAVQQATDPETAVAACKVAHRALVGERLLPPLLEAPVLRWD